MLYNLQEVLDLESSVLAQLPPTEETGYFKECIARFLYQAWLSDHSDMRLLEYSFPLIEGMMVSRKKCLRTIGLTGEEIFNSLCIELASVFPLINPDHKIFSYFTNCLNWDIVNLFNNNKPESMKGRVEKTTEVITNVWGNEVTRPARSEEPFPFKTVQLEYTIGETVHSHADFPQQPKPPYILDTFSTFLATYRQTKNKKGRRIVDAVMKMIDGDTRQLESVIKNRTTIINHLAKATRLSVKTVRPFYLSLIASFLELNKYD